MTPPGERSIRNISVTRKHHAARPSVSEDHSSHDLPPDGPAELPHRRPRRRKNRLWLIVILVVAIAAFLGLLLSTVFAGATVTVYPKTQTVNAPSSLTAAPNAPIGTLAYQTVTVSKSASVDVPAQGTQKVSRPASGTVVISNSYNATSQRLIANTRFASSDGKIYRIRDSVTVPGMKGSSPGTVAATIYADSPGPEYNKGAGETFSIPGFKGDPRYSKFSAKADSAIAGGFVGDEPAVAPAALSEAKTSLQQKVDADARAAAAQQIPEGYVAIPGTLEVTFSDLTQVAGADKNATLTQSATATGIIVRQSDLASAIARKTVSGYSGEAVAFVDAKSLDVSIASTSKRSDGTITLSLKGETTLIWQFDPNALAQALTNKNKSQFQQVVAAFQPAIAKADASVRPFWKGVFPSDPAKIKVKQAGQ